VPNPKSWPKRMHDAVVIALSSPVLVGVYENGNLIEEIRSEAMSSDALPEIFDTLLKKYRFSHLVYAKGPGSFMGIKVTYLFLKTLSIVQKIPLLAEDAFFFNENHPIKAVGKLYFVKNSNTITMQPMETPELGIFKLPRTIRIDDFTPQSAPYYGIDAVG
jgi:tRNA threonylcarbamoyladenosine biosynthesis protein TsaB